MLPVSIDRVFSTLLPTENPEAPFSNGVCYSLRFIGGLEKTNMANSSLLGEFWEFLKYRKRYWLFPIVIVMLLLGALIVFTETSAVAPFIYALF